MNAEMSFLITRITNGTSWISVHVTTCERLLAHVIHVIHTTSVSVELFIYVILNPYKSQANVGCISKISSPTMEYITG